jgi:hypothetical protein
MGGLGHHRHVDLGATKRLGAEEAPESGSDHHDPVAILGGLVA